MGLEIAAPASALSRALARPLAPTLAATQPPSRLGVQLPLPPPSVNAASALPAHLAGARLGSPLDDFDVDLFLESAPPARAKRARDSDGDDDTGGGVDAEAAAGGGPGGSEFLDLLYTGGGGKRRSSPLG